MFRLHTQIKITCKLQHNNLYNVIKYVWIDDSYAALDYSKIGLI
jgi:hypothetical protein